MNKLIDNKKYKLLKSMHNRLWIIIEDRNIITKEDYEYELKMFLQEVETLKGGK